MQSKLTTVASSLVEPVKVRYFKLFAGGQEIFWESSLFRQNLTIINILLVCRIRAAQRIFNKSDILQIFFIFCLQNYLKGVTSHNGCYVLSDNLWDVLLHISLCRVVLRWRPTRAAQRGVGRAGGCSISTSHIQSLSL